jgi:hypothetical protein
MLLYRISPVVHHELAAADARGRGHVGKEELCRGGNNLKVSVELHVAS